MEQCQHVDKAPDFIQKEEEHKAMLMIVAALQHGKNVEDIIQGLCVSEWSSSSSKTAFSKALMKLADEICYIKQVECVTAAIYCEVFGNLSLQHGLKLFITAVENTHITIGEVVSLLHPEIMADLATAKSVKSLPICCCEQVHSMVSFKLPWN